MLMTETNGSSPPSRTSATDKAERLLADLDALSAELEAERVQLVEKIRGIEVLQAKLRGGRETDTRGPGPSDSRTAGPGPSPHRNSGPIEGTIPALLMSIVSKAPGGMTSKDVIAAATKKRPKLKPNDVLAGLYRLHRKKGWLRAEGPKGSMRYFVAETKEVTT